MFRYRFLIPPSILVLVALHQIYLSQVHLLSPWKGGGFGMFSSTEPGAARFVRIFLEASERSEELQIPHSLEEMAHRAAIYPGDRMLNKLGAKVLKREKRYQRPVDLIRIEVWRTRFDPDSLKPASEKLRNYDYKVAERTD